MDARRFDQLARDSVIPTRRGVLIAIVAALGDALFRHSGSQEANAKKGAQRRKTTSRRRDQDQVQANRKKRRKKKKCPGGLVRCGTSCIDLRLDPLHCGSCGNDCGAGGSCQQGHCLRACGGQICQFDHASARCENDTCVLGTCETGWQNCDGDPGTGCETNILTDVRHCGDCSTRCGDGTIDGTPTCINGRCGATCHEGFASCDNGAHCDTDLRSDRDHCGACGHVCHFPNAIRSCEDGVCVMGACSSNRPAEWFPLFANCDDNADTGCETDIHSDARHCGGCHQSCPEGKVCWLGTCELPCGEGGPCRVFVTAGNFYRGNLGGLSGADASCQRSAELAGLPGTYMAWLSDANASPSTRFTLQSSGPYRTVDGVTIANNWADLTDGALAETIFVTETGYFPGGFLRVWTHTKPDGTAGGVGDAHCQNWTTTSYVEQGDAGFSGSSGAEWTAHSATDCVGQKRLYCFQQGA